MIEAVVAVLVCEDEIFVIKLQPHLRAFPGYHAFPGGKIDEQDQPGIISHPQIDDYPQAYLSALCRELEEELQFNLASAFDQGAVLSLSLFGKAVTPAFERVRFCAHYYKVVVSYKPEFLLEENEIEHAGWYQARRLYDAYLQGKALMVVPMCNTLRRLAEDMTANSVKQSISLRCRENWLAWSLFMGSEPYLFPLMRCFLPPKPMPCYWVM